MTLDAGLYQLLIRSGRNSTGVNGKARRKGVQRERKGIERGKEEEKEEKKETLNGRVRNAQRHETRRSGVRYEFRRSF